jgi:hypothetical protein
MASRKGSASGVDAAVGGATGGEANAGGHPQTPTRSGPIAAAGVSTGEDFANLMSALMSDILEGAVSPMVANAAVNAGGKLLKITEMQHRYGTPKESKPLTLTLAPGR